MVGLHLCLLAALLAISQAKELTCGNSNYDLVGGRCLRIQQNVINLYDSAKQACQADGAQLVMPNSQAEQESLLSWSQIPNKTETRLWVGLQTNTLWRWANNSTLDFSDMKWTKWGLAEVPPATPICVLLNPGTSEWTASECTFPPSREVFTVCQMDAVGSRCYDGESITDYHGDVSTTINGLQCQNWTSETPHKPNDAIAGGFSKIYGTDGLPDNNKCRNPDESTNGPWCYTTDPQTRWQYCFTGQCDRVPTIPPTCPQGWSGFGAKCYLFSDSFASFSGAQAKCKAVGGTLAMPKTSAINSFMFGLNGDPEYQGWVGLTKVDNEWVFTDGSETTWTQWSAGPASDRPTITGNDCAALGCSYSSYCNDWFAHPCSEVHRYTCEKDL